MHSHIREGQHLEKMLRAMPKTEVHLHLEGLIDEVVYARLQQGQGEKAPVFPRNEVKDLPSFIEQFCLLQDSIDSPQELQILVDRLAHYLKENNVIYAETFFSPNRLMDKGLSLESMIEVLVWGIRQLEAEQGRTVRLLVDVSRSFGPEKAMRIVEYLVSHRIPEIIGIGLGGLESEGETPLYQPVFRAARAAGLKTVAHAGEDSGPRSIRDALDILQVDRVGHATSACQDPELMRSLRERNIPVEVCLTSNVHTGRFVPDIASHPVRAMFEAGIPICINSDDPAIFQTDITREYLLLMEHQGFTLSEIEQLHVQAVDMTFAPNKAELMGIIRRSWDMVREQQPQFFA